MSFPGGPEVGLHTEVQLDAPGAKPCAAARGQDRRLIDLCHPQDARVEVPGGRLLPGWHCQLDVVQALEHTGQCPRRAHGTGKFHTAEVVPQDHR